MRLDQLRFLRVLITKKNLGEIGETPPEVKI
jgi:hypothetical protein